MKTLIKTLAHGLSLEGETRPLAPTVYTTAIRSEGALVESLAGIAQIAQGLGFTATTKRFTPRMASVPPTTRNTMIGPFRWRLIAAP